MSAAQLTVSLRLPFQILGAFADPSGVPMQGMKIKNVVPGKTRSFFRPVFVFFCFVFLGHSIAYTSLDIPLYAFETRVISPVSSFWLPFVVCVCVWSEAIQ